MGGTGGEGFASALSWLHSKNGIYDEAVGEEDSDDDGPQNTADESEHHYLIDGCVWGGDG